MCLQRLIATRRASEILGKQYGLECKQDCTYFDLLLYQFALTCPTVDPGVPPFTSSQLPPSITDNVDCSGITVSMSPLSYGTLACDSNITTKFLSPTQIINVSNQGGDIMIGENKYILTVVGSAMQTLPADTYLHSIVMTPDGDSTVKVGVTSGGEEIVFSTDLLDGEKYSHPSNLYFSTATTLHFTGNMGVIIYTR